METSQTDACMDQWTNLDIFQIIKRAIEVAASDYPNEFKIRRGEIAHELFTCNLIQCSKRDKYNMSKNVQDKSSSDHQLRKYSCGEVNDLLEEIQGKRHLVREVRESVEALQKNGLKDVSAITRVLDGEWKETLNEGMNVEENMVVGDQAGVEDACLSEWVGLACPPIDDFAFFYANATEEEIDLSTIFDGIDDNNNDNTTENAPRRQAKQLKLINKKQEKVPKRPGKQLKLAYNVVELDSMVQQRAKVAKGSYVVKTNYVPKKACAAHTPRVLDKKTPEDKIKATKRKCGEENEGAENMKRRRKVNDVHDRLRQKISRRRHGSIARCVVAHGWPGERENVVFQLQPITFGDGKPLSTHVVYDCIKNLEEE
ncbi:hypothetical protein Tco_1293368 [Tanacetum coccineum]